MRVRVFYKDGRVPLSYTRRSGRVVSGTVPGYRELLSLTSTGGLLFTQRQVCNAMTYGELPRFFGSLDAALACMKEISKGL